MKFEKYTNNQKPEESNSDEIETIKQEIQIKLEQAYNSLGEKELDKESKKELKILIQEIKKQKQILENEKNEKIQEWIEYYKKNINQIEDEKSPIILEKLSEDEDYDVRKSVAQNLNTPINILENFSEDEDIDVKMTACRILRKINSKKHKQ